MADDDTNIKGPQCPNWDGNPTTWRRWKEDVKVWQLSCKKPADGDTWPAGRMLARLTGSARAVALRITHDRLSSTQEAPWRGVTVLMDLLAQELIPRQELRQTDALSRFYEGDSGVRRAGQSMHAFNSYFLQEVEKLRDEGIKTEHMLLAWWYMKKARLTAERKERLLGLLSARDGDTPSYDDLPVFMSSATRLFPDIHRGELAARTSHSSQSSRSGGHAHQSSHRGDARGGGNRKHVHVAEHEETSQQGEETLDEHGAEDDAQSNASGSASTDVAAHLRAEAAYLAEDIQHSNEWRTAEEQEQLEEAAETLAAAAETIQQLRKRKGAGKSKGSAGPSRSGNHGAGGRGQGNNSKAGNRTLQQRKASSTCRACGMKGHWAGDAECRGASSSIPPSDTLAIVHEAHAGDLSSDEPADCLVIGCSSVLEQSVHLAKHDNSNGVEPQVTLDCGSNHNIIGEYTLQQISEARSRIIVRYTTLPVQLSYRFGGGEVERTRKRVVLRLAFLPSDQQEVTFSVVGGVAHKLPALLGREYLDQTGAVVDFKRGLMTLVDQHAIPHVVSLQNTRQGHLGHALLVDPWSACGGTEITERQARRWTRTQSTPRLQRWMKALFCFVATCGSVLALAGAEESSVCKLNSEADIQDIVGVERDLKEGQRMQLASSINYVRHLAGLQPSDVACAVGDLECPTVYLTEQNPDLAEEFKIHLFRWRQHVRWHQRYPWRNQGVPTVHLCAEQKDTMNISTRPERSTCNFLLHGDSFGDQLRVVRMLADEWGREGQPCLAVVHHAERLMMDQSFVEQLIQVRRQYKSMRWLLVSIDSVDNVLPSTLSVRLRRHTLGEGVVVHSSFMPASQKRSHTWTLVDLASQYWHQQCVKYNLLERERLVTSQILPRLQASSLPLSVARTNVYESEKGRLRGLTLGALVVRGRGIAKATQQFSWLVRLVAKFAHHLPPYMSIQLNEQRSGVEVKKHTDAHNASDSYIMCFGDYDGGVLSMHRHGRWQQCPTKHVWHRLPKGAEHLVTNVTRGTRYSLTLFVPTGCEKLPKAVWRQLQSVGFPVARWRYTLTQGVFAVDDVEEGDVSFMQDELAPDMYTQEELGGHRSEQQPHQDESHDYGFDQGMNEEAEAGPQQGDGLPNWAKAYPRRGKKVDNTEDPPTDDAPVTKELRQAAKRLHEDLGHPPAHKLVAALRNHGASAPLLKAASEHVCVGCLSRQRPAIPLSAKLPLAENFNDLVHLDLFDLHDIKGQKLIIMTLVDHATQYQQ
eukprot:4478790-Amphidinium_carterae.2